MEYNYRILAIAGLLLVLLLSVDSAYAYPSYRQLVQEHYGKSAPCEACHVYGGASRRNQFGDDFKKFGESTEALAKLDNVDSDRDGVNNQKEFRMGSNPGDRESTPKNSGRLWKRALKKTPVPVDALKLVMKDVKTVQIIEGNLSDVQVAKIKKGSHLEVANRFPTLYSEVQYGVRGRIAVFRVFSTRRGLFSLVMSVDVDRRIEGIALLRSGEDETLQYRKFLDCLENHTIEEFAEVVSTCPQNGEFQSIADSILGGMWMIRVFLADVPSVLESTKQTPGDKGKAGVAILVDSVNLDGVSTNADTDIPLTFLSIALLILLIYGSIKLSTGHSQTKPVIPRLHSLSGSLKLLAGMMFFSLLIVQFIAAINIVYQTTVLHGSVQEYFNYMSYSRLLGLSHSHIFGFAIMYGAIGLMLTMTDVSEKLKCLLIATILWCGMFDVLAWWGIKYMSHSFHWLSLFTGAASGVASLWAAVIVALGLKSRSAKTGTS